jgi:predicted deacylase
MPIHVVHGRKPGPVLLVTAAIHGDELTGVEVIRRLLMHKSIDRIRGTLIAIPVVNVYGFVSKSRYLPDRRDLNRSFPGSEKGSMASRLANVVMSQIVTHCTHIVDFHSAAVDRQNLPQIRAKISGEPEIEALARAFGVPVILDSNLLEGSFRSTAYGLGIPILVYEAGEALRFDEVSIRAGVRGVLNVMSALGMRLNRKEPRFSATMIANTSRWVRAPQSGILRALVAIGGKVAKGDTLAFVNDPLGENSGSVSSPVDGIIIGKTNLPLVFEGEAIFNIASYESLDLVSGHIDAHHEKFSPSENDLDGDEPALV